MKARLASVMVIFLFFTLVSVLALNAQTASTGALTVVVTDPSGAAILGAEATITSSAGESRTLKTQVDGTAKFVLLNVGNYKVTISDQGFKTVTVPSVSVGVAETHVLTQSLELGATTQQVTVNGNVEVTQTESSAVGSTVNQRTLSEVPLATRNFTQIMNLSSGVTSNVNDATTLGRGNQNIVVNGTSDISSNLQMDGFSITGFMTGGTTDPFGGLWGTPPIPSPDALQEFKIQTSDYDAGYGHSGGANVNIVTKSGTNDLHGSAFEFVRNNMFDANGFFQNLKGSRRGELKQNQYGGTIGGPILKDKLFAFFSYQGTRQVNGVASSGFSNLILPGALTDDRSATTLQTEFCTLGPQNQTPGTDQYIESHAFLYSPTKLTNPSLDAIACPGGPGQPINPVALGLLQAKLPDGSYVIPSPTSVVNGVGHALFSVPATFQEDQGLLNFDYVISPKHTLSEKTFYTFGLQDNTFQGTQPPGGSGTNLTGSELSTTKLTSILSNTLVNEVHFSYLNTREILRGHFPLTTTQFGVTGAAPYWTVFPQVTITGLFGFGGAYTDTGNNPQVGYEVGDQLSWNHGRHTIRLGYGEEYNELNLKIFGRTRGTLTFQTWEDFLLGLTAAQNGTTCNGCGDQSNIASGTATIQGPPPGGTQGDVRQNYLYSFIQDDFKMSPRLTWNLGLRWEYNGNPYDTVPANDQVNPSFAQFLANAVPPAGGTYAGFTAGTVIGTPLPPGIPQRKNRLYTEGHSPFTNFAPRIGFAWQPFSSSGKLVVRGSGGIFYIAGTAGFISNVTATDEPQAYPLSRSGTSNDTASWSCPFCPVVPIGFVQRFQNSAVSAGSAVDPNMRAATMTSESLNVQYAIKSSLSLEVGYVGNRVEHIIVLGNPQNIPLFATATQPVNCSHPTGCIATNGSSGPTGPAARTPVMGLVPFGMSDYASVGDSEYSSLQTTLRKTFSHGLQFQAAYTYGRTFTDVRGASWVAGGSFTSNDPTNRRQLHGPADFDRPQRLVVSYTYQLPDFEGSKGFTGKALSGWGLSGVTIVQSGQSYSLTDPRGGTAYGGSTSRAQTCAAVPQSVRNQIYAPKGFHAAAATGTSAFVPASSLFCVPPVVANPTPGQSPRGFGNTPPGFAVGPGQFNWDMSITKKTVVGGINENAYLEFRSEFFNAFNRTELGNPSGSVTSASFGQITTTNVGPRIIQLALKYVF
ncbi:MAG TPA: carboxypeptidase-like regulatory domain-containing protein [Verrucomicrobiae bacterium]|nr:carboxypeptidase-like regulatory domain-containing protein [Verrucomicrobiae bacterium]